MERTWMAPLSMGFSRQEYWGGLPFPSPGDRGDLQRSRDWTWVSALQAVFTIWATREAPPKAPTLCEQVLMEKTWILSRMRVSSFLFTVLSGEMTSLLLNPYSWTGCLLPSEWSESHSVVSDSFLQARILEWVAFPFSRGSSQPRDWTKVSCIAGRFFTSWASGEAQEYWSGWPVPSPMDLPNPGIKLASPALQADSLPTELWWLAIYKTNSASFFTSLFIGL